MRTEDYPMFDIIAKLLQQCVESESVLPPTELYNESWMIRIVVDWFSTYAGNEHQFSFLSESRWYSEAYLPTTFTPTTKIPKDELGEYSTQADAIIGDFTVGNVSKRDFKLTQSAKQFLVVEAKMSSALKPHGTNVEKYDQAARTVACMAEALKIAKIEPDNFEKIGFYVVAPSDKIECNETFKLFTNIDNIKDKVNQRVEAYSHREDYQVKKYWFDNWFMPLLNKIDIECLSWESVIKFIQDKDDVTGNTVDLFYERCKEYNE